MRWLVLGVCILGVDSSSVEIVEAPNPGFIPESRKSVEGTRFWPGCLEGRPVAVRMLYALRFEIHRR